MHAKTKPAEPASLAKPLAPEDVRRGDYVAVLDEEHEWCAANWYYDPPAHVESVIRVRMRPRETAPPLEVIDACLPFVYVKPPTGEGRTLDLRAVRLVRLDRGYARRVGKAIRAASTKKKKPTGKH